MRLDELQFARTATVRVVSRAAGWDLHTVNPTELTQGSCCVSKEQFHEIRQELAQVSLGVAAAATERAMRAVVGVATPTGPAETELAVALTVYVSKTGAYARSDNANLAPHFVVIHYGQTGRLHPFAIPGGDRYMLESFKVFSAIDSVIEMDRNNHPAWVA